MDARTEELIRGKAFELSEAPDRATRTAIDNWLEAERLILGGLAEEAATYETAAPTGKARMAQGTTDASSIAKASTKKVR